MKKTLLLVIFGLIFFGCKKDNNHQNNISSIIGNLLLSRLRFTSLSATGIVEEKYEYAEASFISEGYYKDAGIIKYGDSTLHQQSITLLYLSDKHSDSVPAFIHSIDGGQIWSVSGNSINDIPAFTAQAPNFSSVLSKNFDSIPIIHKSQAFTIDWDSSTPCDSISIGIYQSNNVVESGVIPGNISSFSLSPSQLSIFENFTRAYVVIEGRNYKNITASGIPIIVETNGRRACEVKIID
jgi:hypothetical protein